MIKYYNPKYLSSPKKVDSILNVMTLILDGFFEMKNGFDNKAKEIGVKFDYGNIKIFEDISLIKHMRTGFYGWLEYNGKDYGYSWDCPGVIKLNTNDEVKSLLSKIAKVIQYMLRNNGSYPEGLFTDRIENE